MSPRYKMNPDKDYILWQLPCSEKGKGMGYVIAAADGRHFIIDGGGEEMADYLVSFIRNKCDGEVTAWFLTHPHPGHAGALCKILENLPEDIRISKILNTKLNFTKIKNLESKYYDYVYYVDKTIKDSKITTVSVSAGDRLKFGRTLIRVFSGGDADFSEHYLDNTSMVLRFNMYCSSAIFFGDIRREASVRMLERYKNELNCDIVQMANHGCIGAVSEIYTYATPDICLWSTSEKVALGEGRHGEHYLEMRRLMEAFGATEHYVSGIDKISEIRISY